MIVIMKARIAYDYVVGYILMNE